MNHEYQRTAIGTNHGKTFMNSNQKPSPSGRGGARENAGRPKGGHNRLAEEARKAAQATGKLPHEILLSIARGEPQEIQMPQADGTVKRELKAVSLDDARDAAKAAAPYFAPKISTVEVIHGVPDHELDSIIAQLAAEAGIGAGASGEGSQSEAAEGSPTPNRRVQLRE